MNEHQFVVQYNGHPVEVTALDNETYRVQVTYKPLNIRLQKNNEGQEHWVEAETQQESYVSREVGKLIHGRRCAI